MKQFIGKSIAAKSLALLAIITALFSFSSPLGGDLYEIYLDNKMVVKQYVTMKEPVKTLELDKSIADQQLDVFYSHCGKTGTKRSITIRDGQNILKQWSYPDGGTVNTKMACKVKDLLSLQKTNNPTRVDLIYSSQEMPEGKILATLVLENDSRASAKR